MLVRGWCNSSCTYTTILTPLGCHAPLHAGHPVISARRVEEKPRQIGPPCLVDRPPQPTMTTSMVIRARHASLRERLDAQARAMGRRDGAPLHVNALIIQLLPFVRLCLRSRTPELGIELVAARRPSAVLALERGIV